MDASFFNSLPASLDLEYRVEQGGWYQYLASDGAIAWSRCTARSLDGAGLVAEIWLSPVASRESLWQLKWWALCHWRRRCELEDGVLLRFDVVSQRQCSPYFGIAGVMATFGCYWSRTFDSFWRSNVWQVELGSYYCLYLWLDQAPAWYPTATYAPSQTSEDVDWTSRLSSSFMLDELGWSLHSILICFVFVARHSSPWQLWPCCLCLI